MITPQLISQITDLAKGEITKYNAPSPTHFEMSLKKGKEFAKKLKARQDLVTLGICLMDVKLGEAMHAGKITEHVAMSLAYTKEILEPSHELTEQEKAIIYNAVESHHGAVPHTSLESEIVTNADCYRFIHPTGVTEFIRMLSKRELDSVVAIVEAAEAKLDEKWTLVTLPAVKAELEPYYRDYKKLFAIVKKG